MTATLEGGEKSAARPGPYFTPGKEPATIIQEARWAENLAPPEFDPRTVQPVVSRYTDWATQPTLDGGK